MKTVKFFIWYLGAKPKKLKDFIQLIKYVYRQKFTEIICMKKHNNWEQMNYHGAGKYVYNLYRCNICNKIHISFKINK